jgi:predicted regulator of Ras-like GTPase activity (Roadblock/LC7/MglB family)/predicted Zn-dependent protease
MSTEIKRLSDELARDPSSLCYIPLADALRRRGERDVALKLALRGLERHAHNAAAHDLVARLRVERGEMALALEAWAMAERLSPGWPDARRGMGYALFRLGRLVEAEECLSRAAADGDEEAKIALARVRSTLDQRMPAGETRDEAAESRDDSRGVFADALADGPHTALLLDRQGLVLAGTYMTEDGDDVAAEIGAELSGVREEAERMALYLELGAWRAVVAETDVATVALAPVAEEALLLVASDRATPLGLARRVTARCAERARRWLEEVA